MFGYGKTAPLEKQIMELEAEIKYLRSVLGDRQQEIRDLKATVDHDRAFWQREFTSTVRSLQTQGGAQPTDLTEFAEKEPTEEELQKEATEAQKHSDDWNFWHGGTGITITNEVA